MTEEEDGRENRDSREFWKRTRFELTKPRFDWYYRWNRTWGFWIAMATVAVAMFMKHCIGPDKDALRWPSLPSSSEEAAELPAEPPKITAFADKRDGRAYRAVKIGGKTWMAENLNFRADKSKCYGDADSNCQKYGRLYDWHTAMAACPAGWRVPTTKEWLKLAATAGTNTAAVRLKAASGWNWNDKDSTGGDGTDNYGFSALPGGCNYEGNSNDTSWRAVDGFAGNCGSWWTADELKGYDTPSAMWVRIGDYHSVAEGPTGTNRLCSVRCVKK